MGDVVRFGSGEEGAPEVARFQNRNGSPEDFATVEAMGHDQVRAALALWTAGATYGDIAAQLKFRSPQVAGMAIERALSEQVDDTADRSKQRRKVSLTLERMMRSIMPKAVDPNHPEQLAAVRTTVSILDRYSKLNGLDAPIQVDVNMPDDEQFQKFIQLAAVGAGLAVPEEGDPFADIEDAEIVEEDEEDGPTGNIKAGR